MDKKWWIFQLYEGKECQTAEQMPTQVFALWLDKRNVGQIKDVLEYLIEGTEMYLVAYWAYAYYCTPQTRMEFVEATVWPTDDSAPPKVLSFANRRGNRGEGNVFLSRLNELFPGRLQMRLDGLNFCWFEELEQGR